MRIAKTLFAVVAMITMALFSGVSAHAQGSAKITPNNNTVPSTSSNYTIAYKVKWGEVDYFDGYGPHDANGYHTKYTTAVMTATGEDRWWNLPIVQQVLDFVFPTRNPWSSTVVCNLSGTNECSWLGQVMSRCPNCYSTFTVTCVAKYTRVNVLDITKPDIKGTTVLLWQNGTGGYGNNSPSYSGTLNPQLPATGAGPHMDDPAASMVSAF